MIGLTKIPQEILDEIAILEVQALKDGLADPEMKKNPAFLEKVRKFLQQNKQVTTAETPGMSELQKLLKMKFLCLMVNTDIELE